MLFNSPEFLLFLPIVFGLTIEFSPTKKAPLLRGFLLL